MPGATLPEVSYGVKNLIDRYKFWQESLQPKSEARVITVDEIVVSVASFYEKIRGIIDWQEEHLLKRRAIERILKKRLFSKLLSEGIVSDDLIAESLVLELIRGGHFPNGKIEEIKIEEVQKTINKYIFIVDNAIYNRERSKIKLYNWILGIAACEIEEILTPAIKERALMNYMFEIMNQRIEFSEEVKISSEEKSIQIYIAVQRALFNLEASVINYYLLRYKYPEWENLSQENINYIAQNIHLIKDCLEKELKHSLGDKFFHICETYDTPFLLLGDVFSENPMKAEEKVSNPELLQTSITNHYNQRVKTLKKRLGRAAFYSTLSIFFTNIFSLLLIEMPFNKWVTGYFFNYWAITIDILAPTLLMFILVATIKSPKKENLPAVLTEVTNIIYKKDNKIVYKIKKTKKKNIIFGIIIDIFYLTGFLAILYLLFLGLYKVNFPPLSYIIFVIFLALIAFAGAKIRQRSKELQVIEEKDTLFYFLIDSFAVPIIQLGKWLTNKWKRYNVIAVFFSILIDMPFTVFIEFFEQWRTFLREKKEEIH